MKRELRRGQVSHRRVTWPALVFVYRLFLHRSGHVQNPVPHHGDCLLEGVDVLKIALRHPYLTGVRIDLLDFLAPLRNLVPRWPLAFPDFIFQRLDLPIPDHEPAFDPRLREARQGLQQAQ